MTAWQRLKHSVASAGAIVALLIAVASADWAVAQSGPELGVEEPEFPQPTPDEAAEAEAEAAAKPRTAPGDAHLDALFTLLAERENPNWIAVQNQIWSAWSRSGSASMDLLLTRAVEAMGAEDYDTALLHLNDLVRLAPGFAEGWNKRATVYFLQGRYGASVADIQQVLVLEPRHFGALAGLGIILDRTGDKAGALRAYRRVIELHPNMEGANQAIERLAPEVDGREL